MKDSELGPAVGRLTKNVLLKASFLLLTVLSAHAQIGNNLIPSLPNLRPPKGLIQLEVPLDTDYPGQEIGFTVQKPANASIPLSLARRIFSETVHSVSSAISPGRKINLKLHLILRLGEQRDFLYIHQPEGTMIGLKSWNDLVFARLLARAVPSGILTEHEADEAALHALRRAQVTVSVEDIKGN